MERISSLWLFIVLCGVGLANAQLRQGFYATSCPNVEAIVREVLENQIHEFTAIVPGIIRIFFHDCVVTGCDGSILIESTPTTKAEKDHPENLSLVESGFELVNRAKQAVAAAGCAEVSCADILAMAARDALGLAGGPFFAVELGRRDGLTSTAESVTGKLPPPTLNLDELTSFFSNLGISRQEMIALSGAHTLGVADCGQFSQRLYNFSQNSTQDPTLNPDYAAHLKKHCPKGVDDDNVVVNLDPTTPTTFDNVYYQNLMKGKGLLTSDQILFEDQRSRPVVLDWAQNAEHFKETFARAMVKLGRVGVKTGNKGNIRVRCDSL